MIPPLQQAILDRLAGCLELSEDIRVGQLVTFLPVLAAAETMPNLADMEDAELLQALEKLYGDLASRHASAPATSDPVST
jgi:hypothetical protein